MPTEGGIRHDTEISEIEGGGGGFYTQEINDVGFERFRYVDFSLPITQEYSGELVLPPNTPEPTMSIFDYFMIQSSSIRYPNPIKISETGIVITGGNNTIRNAQKFKVSRRIEGGEGIYIDKYVYQSTNGQLTKEFKYIILQKAIPVLKYKKIVNNVEVEEGLLNQNSNSIFDGTVVYELNKTSCRGGSGNTANEFQIFYIDNNQSIPAVEGVHYNLISGVNLKSNVIRISFNTLYDFTVKLIVNGYTFSDNKFENFPNQISSNKSVANYYFNNSEKNYEYKYPEITLEMDEMSDETSFNFIQNQVIKVTPVLKLDVAEENKPYYKQLPDLEKVFPDERFWLDEMNSRLDINLLVVDNKTGVEIINKKMFLPDPLYISIDTVGQYKVKIKMIVK